MKKTSNWFYFSRRCLTKTYALWSVERLRWERSSFSARLLLGAGWKQLLSSAACWSEVANLQMFLGWELWERGLRVRTIKGWTIAPDVRTRQAWCKWNHHVDWMSWIETLTALFGFVWVIFLCICLCNCAFQRKKQKTKMSSVVSQTMQLQRCLHVRSREVDSSSKLYVSETVVGMDVSNMMFKATWVCLFFIQ